MLSWLFRSRVAFTTAVFVPIALLVYAGAPARGDPLTSNQSTGQPERPANSVYNGDFTEVAEGVPLGWTVFGIAPAIESGAVGNTIRLRGGPVGFSWLAQTVRLAQGDAFAVQALVGGTGRASVQASWHGTEDGSGAALGAVQAIRPASAVEAPGMLITTDRFVVPGNARTLRVRLVVEGSPDVTATFAHVELLALAGEAPVPATTAPIEPSASPAAAIAPESRPTEGSVRNNPAANVRPQQPQGSASEALPTNGGDSASSNNGAVARIAPAPLKINEIAFERDGGGWIELYNAGSAPVALDGWLLRLAGLSHRLPAVVVPPHGYVLLGPEGASPGEFTSAYAPLPTGALTAGLQLNGGRIDLIDGDGFLLDTVAWGNDTSMLAIIPRGVSSGHSLERRPAGLDRDLAEDLVENSRPSPGAGLDLEAPIPRESSADEQSAFWGAAITIPVVLAISRGVSLWRQRVRRP